LKKRSKKLLFYGSAADRSVAPLIDKVFLLLFVHKKKILSASQLIAFPFLSFPAVGQPFFFGGLIFATILRLAGADPALATSGFFAFGFFCSRLPRS